jgi:DNA-binding XRE family transcriptional regulator
MKSAKKKRLAARGWAVGSAREFLGLAEDEVAFIELKLALSNHLRRLRAEQGLTQGELARRLESSQSRVAKMEAGDASVSLDLLVRSLLAIGTTRRELAKIIGAGVRRSAA